MNNVDQNKIRIIEHFIGYSQYWKAFQAIWKYKPNPPAMRYTIDNLSYKSRLKALGSIDRWLTESVHDTFVTYTTRLKRGSDFELHYIQEKIHSKLRSAMKSLFAAHQDTVKNKKYVFTSKPILEGEEGDFVIDNTYGMAEAVSEANKYAMKFFAEPINESVLQAVLVPGGPTAKDLRTAILMIADDRNNITEVKKFYQALFTVFLTDTKYDVRQIGTLKFYTEMDKLYKPGNTTDPNKTFIKDFLDKWLEKGSKTFRTTNRTATIMTFRKSLYQYFIMNIFKDK